MQVLLHSCITKRCYLDIAHLFQTAVPTLDDVVAVVNLLDQVNIFGVSLNLG